MSAHASFLIVEDELSVQRGLVRVFKRFGHVTTASCVADASDAVAHTPFTGFVLDVRLPDGCGLEFLAQLRGSGNPQADASPAMRSTAAALVYTGYGDRPIAERARALHASFLEKPAGQEQLEHFACRVIAAETLTTAPSLLVADVAVRHRLSAMQIRVLALEVACVPRPRWSERLEVKGSSVDEHIRRALRKAHGRTLYDLAQPIIQKVMTGRSEDIGAESPAGISARRSSAAMH